MMSTAVSNLETSTLINPVSTTPVDFDPDPRLARRIYGLFPAPASQASRRASRNWQCAASRFCKRSLEGNKPKHRFPSDTVRNGWRITLPEWCRDQRNQMTGPADDGELCVKMLNSGAPGVMLDLEDSCVNEWSHHETGVANILACLRGQLSYYDKKRDRTVTIKPSSTVIFTRPRGLHLNQAGLIPGELVSASLFDVARLFYSIDPAELKHPLCIYIPKSESAEEALWWRDLFQALAQVARPAAQLHQVHGAGGVASAGVSDGRVRL